MKEGFEAKRAILTREITVDGPPEAVFPLLCPVREREWLDGWNGRAIFSESGVAEENGVFASEHPAEEDTIWIVTKRDVVAHVIELAYFVPKLQVATLRIQARGTERNHTTLLVEYVRTGISGDGNRMVEESSERFEGMMVNWEASMNHYLRTGSILRWNH